MLSTDLVRARVTKGELKLQKLRKRTELEARAAELLEIARHHVGEARGEVERALDVSASGKERVLVRGLRKLILDSCTFAEPEDDGLHPEAVRAALFLRAAKKRREGTFDRAQILSDVAAELESDPHVLDERLFGDLRSAHPLLTVGVHSAVELVDGYELARPQAVLLKALELRAEVRAKDASALRAVFTALKFHGLLFRYEGDTLVIDGPMALYRQSTRYGLKFAVALKILASLDTCVIEAPVVWGKGRREATFMWDASALTRKPEAPSASQSAEAAAALEDLAKKKRNPFEVAPADVVLELGGQGVLVPDIALVHRETGELVYLEVLGFWSRAAVWRRVEWVQAGAVADKIIFAYSERLRVSERALDEDHATLLSFKGKLNASAIIERAISLLG